LKEENLKYDPLEMTVLRWLKAHGTEDVQGWDDVWRQISDITACTQPELRHCMKMLGVEGLVTYNYIPSIPRVECTITKEGLLAIRTF
jgi:hypothetical protein